MPIDNALFSPLTNKMTAHALAPDDILFSAGETNDAEYFVLEGLLRTFVISHEGKDVTLGFYRGPGVLSPSITRSHDGKSRVHCEAIAQSVAVAFPFASLIDLMQRDDDIRLWGDAVLRNDLLERAQREWALATMSGAQRLTYFRARHGSLEQVVPHHKIASYLGMTPVSFSRLRNSD